MKRTNIYRQVILTLLAVFLYHSFLLEVNAQNQGERTLIVKGKGSFTESNKNPIIIPFDLTKYKSGHYNYIVKAAGGDGISNSGGRCGIHILVAEDGKYPSNEIRTLPVGPGLVGNLGGDFDKPTKFLLVLLPDCFGDPKRVGEYTYEVYLENGKKADSNVPCDDNQVLVNYNSQALNYHSYKEETEICSTNSPNCTLDLVFSTMTSQIRYIVPDTKSTLKVTSCMAFDANIPGPFNKDPIRIVVNEDTYSVTNYTRKGHVFHPGKVTRSVVKKGTSIYVVTYGEGNGKIPTLNELIAPRYWKDVDNQLANAVRVKLPKR